MSTLRARITRCRLSLCVRHWQVEVKDTEGRLTEPRWIFGMSWPEAMQAAYKALSDLDRELMDEVHASRSARRAAMDRHPAGKQRKEPEA